MWDPDCVLAGQVARMPSASAPPLPVGRESDCKCGFWNRLRPSLLKPLATFYKLSSNFWISKLRIKSTVGVTRQTRHVFNAEFYEEFKNIPFEAIDLRLKNRWTYLVPCLRWILAEKKRRLKFPFRLDWRERFKSIWCTFFVTGISLSLKICSSNCN